MKFISRGLPGRCEISLSDAELPPLPVLLWDWSDIVPTAIKTQQSDSWIKLDYAELTELQPGRDVFQGEKHSLYFEEREAICNLCKPGAGPSCQQTGSDCQQSASNWPNCPFLLCTSSILFFLQLVHSANHSWGTGTSHLFCNMTLMTFNGDQFSVFCPFST